ncbi:hypothetical protein PX699_21655 [Sphingobium sp. H39-3-25]|uniref:hypothetical protein n=1 Tax=Sphingobium arseniciresistens TaxID=3030834 RepID=UPI0023B98577|nr:hypothetical protein [Sphingobium arseniciresistens]
MADLSTRALRIFLFVPVSNAATCSIQCWSICQAENRCQLVYTIGSMPGLIRNRSSCGASNAAGAEKSSEPGTRNPARNSNAHFASLPKQRQGECLYCSLSRTIRFSRDRQSSECLFRYRKPGATGDQIFLSSVPPVAGLGIVRGNIVFDFSRS